MRLELGLTQREVASRLGVAQASVHNWERGRKVPWPWIHDRLLDTRGDSETRMVEQQQSTQHAPRDTE
jgi:transcriptional regulator with XRE-family HTH domain